MKKNHYHWAMPLAGVVLFGAAVSAEQDKITYLNSTNRVTLSLRFGLNIHAKFSGIGNSRTTPNGAPYNYYDGYAYPDDYTPIGYTFYWGYDNSASPPAGQYDPVADTIALHQITAAGNSSAVSSGEDKPYPGFELSYDRELLEKENWHDLRFGLEAALNYMKISLNNNSSFGGLPVNTTIYQLPGIPAPFATPSAPYLGTFDGLPSGGTLLEYPGVPGPATTASVVTQDHFDADLWGGRLGPYVELPLTKKIDLRLSGGLAVGLLNGSASWTQTLTPSGGSPITSSGGGDAFDTLWGYYASLDATWQINKRWAVDGAVQFQDLGKFSDSFQGRRVELDLSRSLFLEVGVSYSF